MKYIRCYNNFTSLTYRLVLHLIIPLGGVLMGLVVMLLSRREPELAGFLPGISMLSMSGFLAVYEVMMDGRVFGGSMRKGDSRMDLLKTSPRGVAVFHDAMVGDQIIRLGTHFLACGVCTLLTLLLTRCPASGLVTEWLTFSAATYVVAQTGILAGRLLRVDSQMVAALVMVAGCIVTTGVVMLQESEVLYLKRAPLIAVVCVVVGVLLGVWMVKVSVRRKKEEYHDT